MHFAGWIVGRPAEPLARSSLLATPEGIRLGSTVDELRNAFGERLVLPDEPDHCTDLWHMYIGGSDDPGLRGVLDGPPSGSASSTLLAAGAQSSLEGC